MSSFFRPLKEGFHGVFRHGAMSFSAAVTVTIALSIVSIFLMFTFNMQQFTEGLEQSVQIAVMVDYNYESAEQEDAIQMAISEIPGVTSITYHTKKEEFNYLLDLFDENTRKLYETMDSDNPMHDAFYVEISDGSQLESVADQISQIEGVKSVNFGGSSATTLVRVLRTIRYGGAVLAIALSLLAVALISNTIKLTISARADEIAIMRNVGAKNSFIRSPFLVEGVIIGAMGSIIPMLGTYFGYRYLYQFTGGYVISQMFSLLNPVPFVRQINVALLLIGMAVGFLGSFFSVTRYLRWKR
ncbi:permease-like cell division protein FtsX [Galactobacillus timonensis]|uniref:permease-like cell division protein FtsX n=1 Tax=Galactobacillus timonensis TaxID=2041840 RepID=UPI000C85DF73|nr:permease-like cell division protein FtsX [Galactobacillus timonensis]